MPELPEVEILVRHLAPLLEGRSIQNLEVRRARSIRPGSRREFKRVLTGSTFRSLTRRGKYLLFKLTTGRGPAAVLMLGHLGMTGRMYLQPSKVDLSKHVAVTFSLGAFRFVFEDVRGFGRLSLDTGPLDKLGPEPFDEAFSVCHFRESLRSSAQAIKVKLLDQSLVAGVGNIYACEALFRAGISPRVAARRLTTRQITRLNRSLREVLAEAIRFGSTIPLNLTGERHSDGLFYYGRSEAAGGSYEERLRVYGREGCACFRCGGAVRRFVQGARSTYYCPRCQRS